MSDISKTNRTIVNLIKTTDLFGNKGVSGGIVKYKTGKGKKTIIQ